MIEGVGTDIWENRIKSLKSFFFHKSQQDRQDSAGELIGYDAASGHNSEKDSLPSTRDLKETSPLRSVPPIVCRANFMLPALHTALGVFAVFLRDNIKRLIISGMMLPVVVLANDFGTLDMEYETHTATPLWVRPRFVRFHHCNI